MNTIDYSSDEKEYFSKDWQEFLQKLGMLRKVVEGSLVNKTDAQLLSLLLNKKDIKALHRKDASGQEHEQGEFEHELGMIQEESCVNYINKKVKIRAPDSFAESTHIQSSQKENEQTRKGSISIRSRLKIGFGMPAPQQNTNSFINESAALALVASDPKKVQDYESVMREIEE